MPGPHHHRADGEIQSNVVERLEREPVGVGDELVVLSAARILEREDSRVRDAIRDDARPRQHREGRVCRARRELQRVCRCVDSERIGQRKCTSDGAASSDSTRERMRCRCGECAGDGCRGDNGAAKRIAGRTRVVEPNVIRRCLARI